MKTKSVLGWILVGMGALFLISGLIVLIFATLHTGGDMGLASAPSSVWVSFADSLMDFTIKLLEVEWTPTRVGVFLIVIGMVLDGGGGYVLIANTSPQRRQRKKK